MPRRLTAGSTTPSGIVKILGTCLLPDMYMEGSFLCVRRHHLFKPHHDDEAK